MRFYYSAKGAIRGVHSIFLLFSISSIFAQSTYEPFDYPPGTYLDSVGGVENGWGGTWRKIQGDSVFVVDGSMTVDSVPASGNKANLKFESGGIRYDRPLLERFEDDGFPVWISFMMDFTNIDPKDNVGQVILMDDETQLFAIGRTFNSNKLGFFWWPNVSGYVSEVPSDGLHWVVAKISMSGDPNDDQALLWIDPDPTREPIATEAVLQVPSGGRPNLNLSTGFNAVRIKAEGTPPLDMLLDEIRIGKEYRAVSPNFVPGLVPPFLAFESFDYPAGESLAGQNQEESGWIGPWVQIAGDGADISVLESSLPTPDPGIPVVGNKTYFDLKQGQLRIDRSFNQVVEDDGDRVWMSFLMDFGPTEATGNVGQVVLMNGAEQIFAIGREFGTNNLGFFWWPNNFQFETDIPADALHWIVAMIQLSGDETSEEAYLWIDPSPDFEPSLTSADLVVPKEPDEGLPALLLNDGFDGVRIKAEGEPPLEMWVDELRFGRTFDDVSTIKEIPRPEVPITSIEDLQIVSTSVFPNPMHDLAYFRFGNEMNNPVLKIYNQQGRMIVEIKADQGTSRIAWKSVDSDGRRVSSGMYLYTLSDNTHFSSGKVIVNR